jgi:hypothetical protein
MLVVRAIDVLNYVSDRVIGLSDTGILCWSRPQYPGDPFRSLKAATLAPHDHKWLLWQACEQDEVDEVVKQMKQDALVRHSFPYRTRSLQPA